MLFLQGLCGVLPQPLAECLVLRKTAEMSLGSRIVLILFGGAIFGGGTAAAAGNLMRLTSGDMTNGVVSGVAGGLGLAVLLIGSSARRL